MAWTSRWWTRRIRFRAAWFPGLPWAAALWMSRPTKWPLSLWWWLPRAVSGFRSTHLAEDIQYDPVEFLTLFSGAQGAQGTEVSPRCDGPLGFCCADQSGFLPDSVGVRGIAFEQAKQVFHGLCARVHETVTLRKELFAQPTILRLLFRTEFEFIFDKAGNLISTLVAGARWLRRTGEEHECHDCGVEE